MGRDLLERLRVEGRINWIGPVLSLVVDYYEQGIEPFSSVKGDDF
jgi:hypothetical protein